MKRVWIGNCRYHGHSHRAILLRVKSGGWVQRALQGPTLHRTSDREYVDRTRLIYGPTDDPDVWRLSPLGLLHTLVGLTLDVREP